MKEMAAGFSVVRRVLSANFYQFFLTLWLLGLAALSAQAQIPLRIVQVTLVPDGQLRLVTEPLLPDPALLSLESADFPFGPWTKETNFQRNPQPDGYEFLTPIQALKNQRYYRLTQPSPRLPRIRFLSPKTDVRPGLSLTLLGANFDPAPEGNTVTFELPNQSWTATVREAASNYLLITAPTNLFTGTSSTGVLYRVTAATRAGTGNGVGCQVIKSSFNTLSIQPTDTYIIQSPGTGIETLAVGGGVPPYRLIPQSTNDAAKIRAQLNGPVLQVTAATNLRSGSFVRVGVEDSSVPPRSAGSLVTVAFSAFDPSLISTFGTLLAGTAPPLTLTAQFFNNGPQPERMEIQLKNAGIDLSGLQPGSPVGLLRLYFSDSPYGFNHMIVTEVTPGRAKFDVVSSEEGGLIKSAEGELIQNPPSIVITALGLQAESLMPNTVDDEFIFEAGLIRLPVNTGEKFSLTTTFTSVSLREDVALPERKTFVQEFTTQSVGSGAPRVERLLPIHGEIYRIVRLRGTGFDANPTNNEVTFAGSEGTRVRAEIISQTNNEIILIVPLGAITGPVRLTVGGKVSNDFLFSVRFHAEALLMFESFSADTPVAPRLIHQQVVDDHETTGEVPLQTVIATLNSGQLALAGVTNGQVVGTMRILNFYVGRGSTNNILYRGQEAKDPHRHIFEVASGSIVIARLYAQDNAIGSGVTFQVVAVFLPYNAGNMWDYRFTTPIYRPPPIAGTDVNTRIEVISQPWLSFPGSEMRIIQNSIRTVQ